MNMAPVQISTWNKYTGNKLHFHFQLIQQQYHKDPGSHLQEVVYD